jgi:signal transduction histidine kinase
MGSEDADSALIEELRKTLSHDARNLLHVALGYAHLIEIEAEEDGDLTTVKAYADEIIHALERIDQFCVNLSDSLSERQ